MDNTTRFTYAIKALEFYVLREGHCRVPSTCVEEVDGVRVPLGAWTGYVRQRYKKQTLGIEQQMRLELIDGWQWGPYPPGPFMNVTRNVEIRKMYEEGKSLRIIADVYEISRQRVHQIINKQERSNDKQ